jgi:hypothetical protein
MYSANDTLAGGFPHSEICGSKLVCQLPAAYRRLQRPSSPVIAKASTTCTYSLDPIGLRTWRHEKTKSRVKLALNSPPLSSTREPTETCLFDAITLLFPLRNNMSTTTKLLKNSRCSNSRTGRRLAHARRHVVQATFGSNLRGLEHRGSRPLSRRTRKRMVEVNGIEPMTPCLQSRCSPS